MQKTRRQFSAEFKQEAVQLLIASGKSLKAVADDLGVRAEMLGRWRRQLAVAPRPQEAFPGPGKLPPEAEELRRLKREVEVLKQERDFLKRAAAFFARESR